MRSFLKNDAFFYKERKKNAKIDLFFYKEQKGTQRSFHSFEKNGCPTLEKTPYVGNYSHF